MEKDGFSQEEWLELCVYVETRVLGYKENMKAPRSLYLRLRGLSRGQFMANNNAKKQAEYSYKIILLTFKYCMVSINNAIVTKNFKNENNKLNYIMVIIENNINDVYLKLEKRKKENINTKNFSLEDNYKPKNYFKKTVEKDSGVSDLIDQDIW